jgi:hypothetical protein
VKINVNFSRIERLALAILELRGIGRGVRVSQVVTGVSKKSKTETGF